LRAAPPSCCGPPKKCSRGQVGSARVQCYRLCCSAWKLAGGAHNLSRNPHRLVTMPGCDCSPELVRAHSQGDRERDLSIGCPRRPKRVEGDCEAVAKRPTMLKLVADPDRRSRQSRIYEQATPWICRRAAVRWFGFRRPAMEPRRRAAGISQTQRLRSPSRVLAPSCWETRGDRRGWPGVWVGRVVWYSASCAMELPTILDDTHTDDLVSRTACCLYIEESYGQPNGVAGHSAHIAIGLSGG